MRARYYDQSSGQFTRRDSYNGRLREPSTLHKYIYGNNNSVNFTDPLGLFSLTELSAADSIRWEITKVYLEEGFTTALDLGDTGGFINGELIGSVFDAVDLVFSLDIKDIGAWALTLGVIVHGEGKIADAFDLDVDVVKKAIHRAKKDPIIRSMSKNNNPDIGVDDETGDIFVKKPDGSYSEDFLGNIQEFAEQVEDDRNKDKRGKGRKRR